MTTLTDEFEATDEQIPHAPEYDSLVLDAGKGWPAICEDPECSWWRTQHAGDCPQ